MDLPYILLLAAVLVGMTVQASVGFGFAFFVAPVAAGFLAPEEAVTLLLLLGVAINSLVLFAEQRRPMAATQSVVWLLLAAVPGLLLGTVMLDRFATATLQVVVGVAILAAAAFQLRRWDDASRGRRGGVLLMAGAVAGVLTTATSLNGPAVVVGLVYAGLAGARLRDTIALCLLTLSLCGSVAVVALTGADRALPPLWLLGAAAPAVLFGHRLGARVFQRLSPARHRQAVLTAALLTGAGSVAAGLV